MRKNSTKIVVMLILVFVNLFCCSLFQIVSAATLKNVSNSTLLTTLNGPLNPDTLDYLQYAASNNKNAFFDFDAEKMVDKDKNIAITKGSYDNYAYDHKSVICVSPGDHNAAAKQNIACIMDVLDDSIVVYTSGNEPKVTKRTTTNADKKKAIKIADQFAYCAYMANKKDEVGIPSDFESYKCVMRFQLMINGFNELKTLGVPGEFVPKAYRDINSQYAKNTYETVKDDLAKKLEKNYYYRGRFIFLYGYTSTGASSGQNDCIFNALEEQKETLKIKKVNESGEPLQGVTFKIYSSSSEKEKGTLLAEGTTNKNGIINFDGVEGEWYYVKEIETVGDYEIADPNYKVVRLKEDKQEVEFVNEEKTDFNLTIVKEDDQGTKLAGAQFIIYRHIKDDSGTWYKKAEKYKKYEGDNYTNVKSEADNTDTKYRREYISQSGKKYTYNKVSFDTASSDSSYIFETDANGKISLKNLKSGGDYFAKEIKAPSGYTKLENPVRLGTCPDSRTKTKTIKNTPEGNGFGLTIVKENELGRRLSGAKFVIYKYVEGTEEYLRKDHTYIKTNFENIKANSDYIYTTNIDGKIELTDLEPGTYYAIEVEAPSGYKKINEPIELGAITEIQQSTILKTIKNTPTNPEDPEGELKVIKQDIDTEEKLEGVDIRVTGPDGYNKTAITDENGEAYFSDLKPGDYLVEELSNPMYGYTVMVNEQVTIEAPEEGEEEQEIEQVVVYLNNPKQTGNLRIRKVDADSGRALAGVSFKIKLPNGRYLVAVDSNGNSQYRVEGRILLSAMDETSSESSATEFVTDSSGIIEVHNILVGNYQVVETSLGDHTAYELDDNYILWTSNSGSGMGRIANVIVDRQPSYNTKDTTNGSVSEVIVKNRRKYIDLSGYVWQDISPTAKDAEGGNGLYFDNANDNRDQLLEGILVQLKEKNGSVAQIKDKNGNVYNAEMTTDSKGAYKFERLEIDKLPDYYIEFTYNGMSYQSVQPTLDMSIKNGSRAIEGTNRTEFNSRYETITYGRSNAHNLQYETSNNESKLVYGNKSNYNYGYSGNIGAPVSGVDEQYIITADTYQAYNDYIGGSRGIMTPEEARKNEVEEIENVNLGIETREQIDLSLVKDIDTIKVSINHATHVYQYADRYKSELWKEDPYNMNPQVKFEQEYGTMSYTRALYASDVFADTNITNDTLRVKVTYKIGIKNGSANLRTIVNEIEDYYDSKYLDGTSNVKVGTQVNSEGDIVSGSELGTEFVNSGSNDYYKMKIKGSVEVKDQKESFVYVQLEVKPENIINILGTNDKLYNIAEITSYSTKQGNDIYASIDQDSQPGNLRIEDSTTYEDDTDKAPGLQLVLQEKRKLDGKVFIDTTTGELMTAQVRQGNGEYDDGEPGVKDVEVQLLNLNKNRRVGRYI